MADVIFNYRCAEFSDGSSHYDVQIYRPDFYINHLLPKDHQTPIKIALLGKIYSKFINSSSSNESVTNSTLRDSFSRVCDFVLSDFTNDDRHSPARTVLSNALSSMMIDDQNFDRIFHEIKSSVPNCYMYHRCDVSCIFVKIEKEEVVDVADYDQEELERVLRESMDEFESENYGMVPASKSSIKELSKNAKAVEKSDESDTTSCTICLDEIEVGSTVMCLPCSHMFHDNCIVKWLNKSHLCPICRFKTPID